MKGNEGGASRMNFCPGKQLQLRCFNLIIGFYISLARYESERAPKSYSLGPTPPPPLPTPTNSKTAEARLKLVLSADNQVVDSRSLTAPSGGGGASSESSFLELPEYK